MIETSIKAFLEQNEVGMGQVMTPLRIVLVGSGMGPGVMDIMVLLGKNEVVTRISRAIRELG